MSELKSNNFEIRLVASAEGVPDLYLENMSKAAITWVDEPLEEEEDQEDGMSFLVSDEEGQDDDSDDGEDDDDEEEEATDEGRLIIQLTLSPAIFLEYRQMRDADPEYSITATIVYKDDSGTPIFHHEYECMEGMYLTHESGQKANEQPLVLELHGRYQDCIQFAVFVPPAHAMVLQ